MAKDLSLEVDCKKVVEACLSEYGKVDILVNNAGMVSVSTSEEIPNSGGETASSSEGGSILSLTLLGWQKSHARNLDSCFLMSKYCLPLMIKNKWGRIVNVSSTSNKFNFLLLIARKH